MKVKVGDKETWYLQYYTFYAKITVKHVQPIRVLIDITTQEKEVGHYVLLA